MMIMMMMTTTTKRRITHTLIKHKNLLNTCITCIISVNWDYKYEEPTTTTTMATTTEEYEVFEVEGEK